MGRDFHYNVEGHWLFPLEKLHRIVRAGAVSLVT